ncbi:TPA: tRNA guanosine(15) transglycosylase TgtA [Candidatus Bathyarchaeota archaeon]|nr:tRNA guanosine(15) transglycosylase TgtA [Candidatus Bathyarchaeota archaeon]
MRGIGTFEVRHKDLLGRIGSLETKSGSLKTPHMFPVVNPSVQPVSPREIKEIGFDALMVNAYILKKAFREEVLRKGIHEFLSFDGIVATDSGAYQALVYGKVEVSPEEIVKFQEAVGTDMGVILDVPTGYEEDRGRAKWTVEETLRRAELSLKVLDRMDVLWMGPIQGGIHLDLVKLCAEEMGKKPFHVYAIGSPTQIMENYLFDKLVDMILTAKMNLPLNKPLHLFGAGHPFMFALAVACGCDLFDSAAYAIFARKGKYLTEGGTFSLEELEYFPCSCEVCSSYSPKEVRSFEKLKREGLLARHNLSVCLEEIKRVKQAIVDGRLWELLEAKARAHPSLLSALRKLSEYKLFLEKHSPTIKKKGVFFFGSEGLSRPEIVRHKIRLKENYAKPKGSEVLVLLPAPKEKPFHKSPEVVKILAGVGREPRVHLCFYATPFGLVPMELSDVYPLSQTEAAPLDKESLEASMKEASAFILKQKYPKVLLIRPIDENFSALERMCVKNCVKAGSELKVLRAKDAWGERTLKRVVKAIEGLIASAPSGNRLPTGAREKREE